MRFLAVGDTHANSKWFQRVCEIAHENGIHQILQLGDFGYWPHKSFGQRFLISVEKSLKLYDLTLLWIDGNHENHDWLQQLKRGDDGFARVFVPHRAATERVLHAPRGTRWEWDGVTFLALGGAYSIDKNGRTPHESWWSQELITEAEIHRAMEGGKVDVLVSHDAPLGVENLFGGKDLFPESASNRLAVRAVMDHVQPKLVVHGHYHVRNSTRLLGARVEGYSWDGDDVREENSIGIFDTDEIKKGV